jgi:phosphatidylglycerol---prolipoprotein diacylglyceryl transferase
MYVLAFTFAYFLIPYLLKVRKLEIKKHAFEDIFFWTIIGGLLGGRIFYVLFYNFSYFSENLLKIFAVWEGGMASHGGFIGATLVLFFMCKKYKLPFWKVADVIVIPVGIGLMLGRFGNFINGELYGRITDVAWCMNFDSAEGCRHPSQLYAALKDFILFSVLFSLRNTQWKPGILAMSFIGLYAIFRFIVEFFREPDSQIGILSLGLSQGQWISVFMFFVSVLVVSVFLRKKKRD